MKILLELEEAESLKFLIAPYIYFEKKTQNHSPLFAIQVALPHENNDRSIFCLI